jgi:hypothetical protein
LKEAYKNSLEGSLLAWQKLTWTLPDVAQSPFDTVAIHNPNGVQHVSLEILYRHSNVVEELVGSKFLQELQMEGGKQSGDAAAVNSLDHEHILTSFNAGAYLLNGSRKMAISGLMCDVWIIVTKSATASRRATGLRTLFAPNCDIDFKLDLKVLRVNSDQNLEVDSLEPRRLGTGQLADPSPSAGKFPAKCSQQ